MRRVLLPDGQSSSDAEFFPSTDFDLVLNPVTTPAYVDGHPKTAILYVDFGTIDDAPAARRLLGGNIISTLTELAEEAKTQLIFRHGGGGGADWDWIAGYGVKLNVKSTEYKASDSAEDSVRGSL